MTVIKYSSFIITNLIYQAIKDSILVLNSRSGWKPAMILRFSGEQQELACFERDDTTEAYASCSITWNNQLFIFGGLNNRRQISRLTGHKLERVGYLSFDHSNGACSVMANKFIFLCFNSDSSDYKRCRRSTGPVEQFSQVVFATYDHQYTQTSCSDSKL